MPLTDAEKQACCTATFTKGRGHGYGTPEDGYCPIGAVYTMRGGTLSLGPNGEYSAMRRDVRGFYVPMFGMIAARQDVLLWSGYKTIGLFLDALESRGTTIFPSD